MSDYKICRICLRTECKLYKYDQLQLKPYYEEVMSLKMNILDGLPHYFCYECATMLHKFHKFKEKCYIGQNVLKDIIWKGGISYEAVYKVDRSSKKLDSPLGILKVTKRVKTYCTNDSAETSDDDSVCDEKEVSIQDVDYKNEESIAIVHQDLITSVELNEPPLQIEVLKDKPKVEQIDNEKNREIIQDESHMIDEVNEVEFDDDIPNSPTTVFVDASKEVVKLENLRINESSSGISKCDLKKRNPAFAKQKTRILNRNHWKKLTLTEDEALKEFRKKSEDPKYVAAEFKCTDCFKWFRLKDILTRHRQLRHSESLGPMECRFCRLRFKWNCHLRRHLRSHFIRYECLRCNLIFSLENSAILHEDYHNGVIKKCEHCGEEFKHSSTYYTHLRTTHRSEYLCRICGMSFVSELGLQMHRRVKHIGDDIESPDDDEEVNTFCDKCDIRFETRKAYEEHMFQSAMHTEGVEDEMINESTIPRKVLGKKLKAKIRDDLRSGKIDKDLDSPPQKRRRHKKERRPPKKPMSCHQCGQHFSTQAACMKHHVAMHPGTSFFAPNERYICEICGASLAPGSITTHQNLHSRERMHTCKTCGRTFYSTIGLKRHLVTHTGEKPYQCSLCDKRFTQSNSMKLHYRTIHLKQPYPKRNRRKKKDQPPELPESSESESGPAAPSPRQDVQYLTLT